MMAQSAIADLYDRWSSDSAFRDRLEKDPDSAIRESGLTLDDEDLQALREAKFDLSDGSLAERINKGKYVP
jgi:hypothetical protein